MPHHLPSPRHLRSVGSSTETRFYGRHGESPVANTLQGARRDPRMDYAEDEELHVFISGDTQDDVRRRCALLTSLCSDFALQCYHVGSVPLGSLAPSVCSS